MLAPQAVGEWERAAGKFYPLARSLEEFASRVIDKKDKTPSEILQALVGKVSKLVDEDKYAEALALIEPAIKAMPDTGGKKRQRERAVGSAWNLYGLALKGVNRIAEARAAFDRAVDAGAELNILSLLEDTGDAKGLIAHGLACRERHYFDDYARAWLSRYLAGGYLDTNEPEKAEAELRRIKDAYEISAPAKVTEAREGLEEYIAKKRPGAAHATAFLAWLKPRTYDVSPEVAKANRAWWDGLTEGMRGKLLEGIDKEGAEAGRRPATRTSRAPSTSRSSISTRTRAPTTCSTRSSASSASSGSGSTATPTRSSRCGASPGSSRSRSTTASSRASSGPLAPTATSGRPPRRQTARVSSPRSRRERSSILARSTE
jgi:tetratricopeptide (TPR) repeat protein